MSSKLAGNRVIDVINVPESNEMASSAGLGTQGLEEAESACFSKIPALCQFWIQLWGDGFLVSNPFLRMSRGFRVIVQWKKAFSLRRC